MKVNEPILLIAFNRPDLLTQVIDRLRLVEPKRIFLAVDGPRSDREGEAESVRECQQAVAAIDWPCQVDTLFQESNLGCGLGVSTAISWFFSHVESGIILEDDIIPDLSFFPYCETLLERFRFDERVIAISGSNFVPPSGLTHPEEPFHFAQVPHIWGWASWRRAWEPYELDISGWRRHLPLRTLWKRAGKSLAGTMFWASSFELLARKQVDTWDGQLVYLAMRKGQLTATSNVNLVENIGFGEGATHTLAVVETLPVLPVTLGSENVEIAVDRKAEAWTLRNHFRATVPGVLHQAYRFGTRRWRSS